jgi:hypothetical protein
LKCPRGPLRAKARNTLHGAVFGGVLHRPGERSALRTNPGERDFSETA